MCIVCIFMHLFVYTCLIICLYVCLYRYMYTYVYISSAEKYSDAIEVMRRYKCMYMSVHLYVYSTFVYIYISMYIYVFLLINLIYLNVCIYVRYRDGGKPDGIAAYPEYPYTNMDIFIHIKYIYESYIYRFGLGYIKIHPTDISNIGMVKSRTALRLTPNIRTPSYQGVWPMKVWQIGKVHIFICLCIHIDKYE
jgi:hypothetical protein